MLRDGKSGNPGELGGRLKIAREAAGMSLLDAMTEVRGRLPRPMWVTHETIRRYEQGIMPEDRADPLLVGALAITYKVPVGWLSPAADDQLRDIFELVVEINDTPLMPPEGATAQSICTLPLLHLRRSLAVPTLKLWRPGADTAA